MAIILKHNLDPKKFMWLWAKYAEGANYTKHCTNSIKGKYSRKLSKHNENLKEEASIILDEQPEGSYKAIYICGVSNLGYSKKSNYIHNLHTVIEPKEGAIDTFEFENWELTVENGIFLKIPGIDEVPERYKDLPEEYVTCRIFRWAVSYFREK